MPRSEAQPALRATPLPGAKGLCGSEAGRPWGERSPAGFVFSGRPESLGEGSSGEYWGVGGGQASLGTGQGLTQGSWPGGGAPSQGSKITTPIY